MHWAAGSNPSVEVVRCLVELGGVQQLQATDQRGRLPMHYAARYNPSEEVVRCLVELGGVEQLQARDNFGMSPLHFAAQYNSSVQVMRYLLASGCDRSARTLTGHTPLQLAIEHSTEEHVATMLVEAGADTAGLRLSHSLQHIASRVSMASVLSSFCADNITPLEAAVGLPCPSCLLARVRCRRTVPSQWILR
jgi:ankyrin repeat protein